jgi:hypothetical protein
MHRTTVSVPEGLFRRAKVKAATERVPLSEVLRRLLGRWVTGEVVLEPKDRRPQKSVEKARRTYGMWRDRDPDTFLEKSRAGLKIRDRTIEDARLAP